MKLFERLRLATERNLTLGTVLDRSAALHGDDRLVDEAGDAGLRLTHRAALARVAELSGGIAARIPAGGRVVIANPNSYDTFLLCVAAARAGGIAVPVNAAMTPAEIDHVIADSDAALVVHAAAEVLGSAPLARPAAAEPGGVAAIFYTSGTTGTPKGAELTHRAVVGQAGALAAWPSASDHEAVMGLPVAHIMGFGALLGMALGGIPTYFMPHFRPDDALDAIERRRSTIFVGVPAMYRLMLEAGAEDRDLRSIRVWASGADVMPEELARRFQRMGSTAKLPLRGTPFGQALFVEGYGMVEAGGGVAAKFSLPGLGSPLGGLLGVPLPGYRFRVIGDDGKEVRVGAVGELQVRGPGVLQGYHGDAAATAAVLTDDGWLRTGDLVRRRPLGFVAFAGRGKEVVKSGGYSVYSLEVQTALEEHHAVAEAAVLGLPDERMGEEVVAVVRLLPGEAASEGELIGWCRERLSPYKVPTRVRIVAELPRTGTNKVKKSELRSLF